MYLAELIQSGFSSTTKLQLLTNHLPEELPGLSLRLLQTAWALDADHRIDNPAPVLHHPVT
jgi:hypothetical protein